MDAPAFHLFLSDHVVTLISYIFTSRGVEIFHLLTRKTNDKPHITRKIKQMSDQSFSMHTRYVSSTSDLQK